MSITQNANRVRVESAAKNGTLGSQAGLTTSQIKFDTAITTNNGNLEASPSFRRRPVVVRRGDADEEHGVVQSVDVDGLTCTMQDPWDVVPASGDTYDVAYRLEDCASVAGCDFETDSRQWVMTKRLIVGIGTTTFGFLGITHGQILRVADRGPSESGFLVNSAGRLHIGTIKNDKANLGGVLVFMNDADNELVMEINGSAVARLYEFTLMAGRNPEGVNSLDVTVAGTADVEWRRSQLYGIDAPKFKKRVERFKSVLGAFYLTKGDIVGSPMWDGHLKSELDKTLFDELSAEANAVGVRILIEG